MEDIENKIETIQLNFSPEQEECLEKLMQSDTSGNLAENLETHFDTVRFDISDGNLLVYHHKPQHNLNTKTIVFIVGWGASLNSFRECYKSLINRVEVYHIETREKSSSQLQINKRNMSVDQNAKDISDIIKAINFRSNDNYILAGACWGSSILLQGLINKTLPPTKFVLFDPMHALWFPKWLLNWVIPILPIWFANIIKPLGKRIALAGMKEQVQRQRTSNFIDNGDMKKWKPAALQANTFELLGNLGNINADVVIANGTKDKIHDQRYYPLIAREIPNARFIYMKRDESEREKLIGKVLYEFASSQKNDIIPESLKIFEQ